MQDCHVSEQLTNDEEPFAAQGVVSMQVDSLFLVFDSMKWFCCIHYNTSDPTLHCSLLWASLFDWVNDCQCCSLLTNVSKCMNWNPTKPVTPHLMLWIFSGNPSGKLWQLHVECRVQFNPEPKENQKKFVNTAFTSSRLSVRTGKKMLAIGSVLTYLNVKLIFPPCVKRKWKWAAPTKCTGWCNSDSYIISGRQRWTVHYERGWRRL